MTHAVGYGADPRLRWTEWLPWGVALVAFFLLPEYLSLGARILTYVLFALSLDLILGYAGIITLGHSAFFGLGAYVCGILAAKLGVTDPLLLLAAAAVAGGVLGIVTGAVILRTHGLTQLMLTLAIAAVCLEIANKASSLTGGAEMTPVWARTDRARLAPRPVSSAKSSRVADRSSDPGGTFCGRAKR